MENLPNTLYIYRFSIRKKKIIRSFLVQKKLHFVNNIRNIPSDSTILVWGSLNIHNLPSSIKVVRVEDGFIRSIGLGSELYRPLSLVFDSLGIYYDCSCSSDLENILLSQNLDEKKLHRAKSLHSLIIKNRISKYNLKSVTFEKSLPLEPIHLVIGQVEGDASITFGTKEINSNIKLLKIVRHSF